MSEAPPPLTSAGETLPAKDPASTSIEIVQTLHAASLERWKDRPENESKLNYAVWGAFVGLIVLLVNKDTRMQSPSRTYVFLFMGIAVLFHWLYLLAITSRSIAEIEMQSEVERALRNLDPVVSYEEG